MMNTFKSELVYSVFITGMGGGSQQLVSVLTRLLRQSSFIYIYIIDNNIVHFLHTANDKTVTECLHCLILCIKVLSLAQFQASLVILENGWHYTDMHVPAYFNNGALQ